MVLRYQSATIANSAEALRARAGREVGVTRLLWSENFRRLAPGENAGNGAIPTPIPCFLEVLILNDFKSLFPEVLILIDFKSFAPEVLILVDLKVMRMNEIRGFFGIL